MKTRKQMRNLFIEKIDDLLIQYYKIVDFELLAASSSDGNLLTECTCQKEAMQLIDLMKELELVSDSEYRLLRDVYTEYFNF